ncbi:hypothetical protein MLD38_020912 [Melastoma candidum]|uniref:Uncharacterized protein n=1 Tax=Melastoma candidum TaxID=119954 RepID=A0ACB9QI89_9MYRT|nr:hypothetical protein MLD38_020912 [Melastoma candidum]
MRRERLRLVRENSTLNFIQRMNGSVSTSNGLIRVRPYDMPTADRAAALHPKPLADAILMVGVAANRKQQALLPILEAFQTYHALSVACASSPNSASIRKHLRVHQVQPGRQTFAPYIVRSPKTFLAIILWLYGDGDMGIGVMGSRSLSNSCSFPIDPPKGALEQKKCYEYKTAQDYRNQVDNEDNFHNFITFDEERGVWATVILLYFSAYVCIFLIGCYNYIG